MASTSQNPSNDDVTLTQPNIGTSLSTEPAAKKQKKLTSKVWNWFVKEDVKEFVNGKEITVPKAICKKCGQKFNGCSTAGTSHLSKHYQKKYSIKSGQKELSMMKNLESFTYDEDISKRKLVLAIIMHEYPFSIVEHNYFVEFIKSLRPSFPIQTRNTYKKEILEMYLEEKNKLYNYLRSISCRFSGTMDLWTSRQNKSYLCVTIHFIDDNWGIQKRILNFMCLEGRHTGDNLSEAVLKNLCDWNVDRKLFSFTLDNDSANGVCVKKMIERLNESGALVCGGELFHVRCAAHIINLVVQDGVKKIKKAIDGIREIVLKIKNSPLLFSEFQKRAIECNLKITKGLSSDVCTRWNSTCMMLRDALYFREALERMNFIDPSRYPNFLTNQEWNEVDKIYNCLKYFYAITELLSGTLYPTSNLFFKSFCDIKIKIESWCKNEDPIIKEMAMSMKNKFDKYWYQSNTALAIACFLDPRYKMGLIEYYYPKVFGNGGTKEIEELNIMIKKMHFEYSSKFKNSVDPIDQIGEFDIPGSNSGLGIENDGLDNDLVKFLEARSQPTSFKSDLDNYMERIPCSNKKGFDILSWWKTEGREYPILSRIARDVLAIPVSSVASESAFSTGGRVIDPYRSRLDSETVEALICIQDWVKAGKKGELPSVFDGFKENDDQVN